MTSQLDDEGLHPMVSTLLGGGTITMPPIKSYSRERMMELKNSKASMTRPENLSEDYNGDDGKFSPLKWLEHRWEVEGIKNRPLSKKIDSLCAGADENTGFSPQRRAFSSGCKAPADDKGDYERLGGHGKNWRNGSNGGSDKFASRGNDFKTTFQKGVQLDRGGARGTEWKKDATRGAKFGQRRDDRLGSVSGSEKLPEWADGPTTMDDMIELRGFDEPKKGKNKKNPKEKKETSKSSEQPECAGSRPSSTGLTKASQEPLDDPAIAFSEKKQGALPETDHELAALLGCLDVQKSSRKIGGKDDTWPDNNEESSGGSSRLSRFFAKKSKSPELDAILASAAAANNDENVANPMLAKLFGNNAGDNKLPQSGHGDMKGGMRLEDLERNMDAKEPAKVSPLQDPSQQAQLLHHLQKVAKQQAEAHQHQQRQPTPPNGAPHHLQHLHQGMPQGMPIVADVHLLASFSQNPMLLNAYVENQLQEAINAASRANNGQSIPSQLHEQLRMASHRNKAFLQAQTLAFVNMRNQQQHHQHLQHLAAQQQQFQKGRTPAMIPASVQRQLQKSSSNADQKKEKSSQSPTELAGESSEGQQTEMANHMKKLHMQQNYANMMQAMNSGLGWRGNGTADPQQQQLAANVQMLMAQHQAAQVAQIQGYKMMMNRHHQNLMIAKIQQQQIAGMQERHGMNQQQQQPPPPPPPQQQQQQAPPPPSVPSELSQVGPIQTPLEKLLASVGVQGSQFTGSGIPQSARPMSLEDLEKQLTTTQQK